MNKQISNKNPVSSQENSSTSKMKTSLKATIRDQSGAGKIRIGELLSKEGYITSTQLKKALNYQKTNPLRLGSILIKLGYIDEETIVNVLSRIYNYPAVLISKKPPAPEALKIISYETAKKYMAFPLKLEGENLLVTMAEPTDTTAVENLQKEVQHGLKVSVSSEQDIIEAYRKYYKISDEEYNKYGLKKEEEEEEDVPLTVVDDFGSLVSEAAGEIEIFDFSEQNDLSLSVPGSGSIKLNKFEGDDILDVQIDGSGDIYLKDEYIGLNTLDIDINGSGMFDGYNAETKKCSIDISGSGNCKVNVMENLEVDISGSGTVTYKGNPSIEKDVNAAGNVYAY